MHCPAQVSMNGVNLHLGEVQLFEGSGEIKKERLLKCQGKFEGNLVSAFRSCGGGALILILNFLFLAPLFILT